MQNSVAKKLFAVGLAASTALASFAPLAATAAPHAAGTNVNYNGTVWMIMPDGTRRAYTSAGAFLSYGFNSWSTVVEANADDLALPAGSFIPPQDGKVICSDRGADKGTCYLISGGMKYGFTSAAVFTGRGFSFARSTNGDVSWMASGPTLINDTTAANLPGVLVNNNGTVQLRGASGNLGIPDVATFSSWGYSFADVVPANAADKAMTQSGVMAMRTPGQLSPTATTGTTPTPGSVTVSAAPNMTPASTVPKGATNVPFLKFTISNGGSSAATVTGVTVTRSGAGATTDFSNVYLYQGSSRLTSGRSVNSSTNQAVFNGLNITVPAMGSVTLDVLADMSTTAGAGNVHILTASNVTLSGGGSASGSVSSNAMTMASAQSGSVTIKVNGGTLTNPKVGESNVKISQFQITAGSQEDLTIKRLSLYNSGSINRSYLTNFKLMQAGTQVASVASIDGKDHINFDLNFALDKGNSRTFEVYADVNGQVKPNDTIKVYLEEVTDLYAMGKTYGFGAMVTSAPAVANTTDGFDGSDGGDAGTVACSGNGGDNCSYTSVEGGQLTIAFNGPAGKDIAKDGRDVEVFNFTMTAQANIEVRQIKFTFDNGGSGTANFLGASNGNYTDVKIWDTTANSVVWGPVDFATSSGSVSGTDTGMTVTFTEDIVLNAGQSKTFKMTTDVANTSDVADGDKFRAILNTSDLASSQVKNLDNNTFLSTTDIVPTGNLNGNQMTVKVPGMTISRAGTPVSQSFVKGATMVPMVGINFQASTAKDVKLNSLTLTGIIATSTATVGAVGSQSTGPGTLYFSDAVTTLELYDGTTKIGDTKSPNTSGIATFTNLNYNIPAGTTKTLVVKANSNSSVTAGTKIKIGIAQSTDVSMNDVDGNTVTPTSFSAVNQDTTMANGTTVTLSGAGTVSLTLVTPESNIDDSRIVVAGQSNVTMGRFRLAAANEDLKLTKARIKVAATSTNSIISLTLWDGSTQIAGPVTPDGSGNADFNSITPDFVIPKDSDKVVTVKATFNTVQAGATSGAALSSIFDGNNNFEMRGTGSSNTLLVTATTSPTSSQVVLRKTKPTITVVALPNTTLAAGTPVIGKFTVTADAGARVALKKITFDIALTNATLTVNSLTIRESGGSSDISTVSSTVAVTGGDGVINFTGEQTIEAGQSKTYELKANIASVGTGSASVQTKIKSDTAVVTGTLSGGGAGVGGTDYNFVWSDTSASGHDTSTGDWTNGTYVKPLPTDYQTLSKS